MSHNATNWAIRQKGLKPPTKIVLWHLADCHNPAGGCFPSQKYLADECEMSRSTVNEHLDKLEKAGLIRRETQVDPRTKQQLPTQYHLALDGILFVPETQDVDGEETADASAVSEIRTGAVSGKTQKPCPENGHSRVRNPDTNLVREPVKEPDGGDGVGASDRGLTEREELIEAMGAQPITATGRIFGNIADMAEVARWSDLGLTHSQQIQIIRETMTGKPDGPPKSFKYFTASMQRAAAELSRPALQPAQGPTVASAQAAPRFAFDLSNFEDIE
jgi:DNA-binding Lrp family transcriptional regulator